MSVLQHGIAKSGVSAFYSQEIDGSLRFPRTTTSYLSRTFGTPSTNGEKVFTISVWVKRAGNTGNNNYIIDGHTANEHVLAFEGDLLRFGAWNSGDEFNIKTNSRKLRDSTAWYHIVCAVDTREAVASDRVTLYINGEELNPSELQGTYPSQNYTGRLNVSGNTAQIGRWGQSTGREFEGYMADFHFIDAQKLSASDFGETKGGAWIPKAYSGTYGNNGFRLEFDGNTNDTSGNSNNWTAAGGIGTHDYMLDSPTNNFCTLNYWAKSVNATLGEGNVKLTNGANDQAAIGAFGITSGKWYWEVYYPTNDCPEIGLMPVNEGISGRGAVGSSTVDALARITNGSSMRNASWATEDNTGLSAQTSYGAVRVVLDADAGKLWVSDLNGTYANSGNPVTGTNPQATFASDWVDQTEGVYPFALIATGSSQLCVFNFGQESTFADQQAAGGYSDENGYGDFAFAVPSGYLALCTANLPTPAADPASDVEPRDYFETFKYVGNGSGQQIGDVIKKPADTTTISDSLIFNDDDGAYLSRTHTLGNRKTWTWSGWVKIGNVSANSTIFSGGSTTGRVALYKSSGGNLITDLGGTGVYDQSVAVFRDSSAWYHLVWRFDTTDDTDGTGANRSRIYVNGEEITLTKTRTWSPNTDYAINSAALHTMGVFSNSIGTYHLDGYLAEVHFIDGTAHAPTDFGNFDANGIWIPKTVTAVSDYGTNGFYLDFADSSALGDDESGNTNDWTANNFATTDQVGDSPTDNHVTFDTTKTGVRHVLSEGNLEINGSVGNQFNTSMTTTAVSTGKYYWEFNVIDGDNNTVWVGVANPDSTCASGTTQATTLESAKSWNIYGFNGTMYLDGTSNTTFTGTITFGTGDLMMLAMDAETGKVWIGKNDAWFNSGDPAAGTGEMFTASGSLLPIWGSYKVQHNVSANFGQRAFTYTAPTGYLALSENNITVDDQNLESPDLVWIKSRGAARHSGLWDSVRGVRQLLQTSSTDLETDRPYGVLNFNTNGFTLGPEDPSWHYNELGINEVAWCWKAGTSFSNSAGTNDASIASSGSVNTESGFSITTFTATGSNETVAHGLTAKPDMIIIIRRDDSGSDQIVYHSSLGATKNLRFNNSDEARTQSDFFLDTEPTSNVFSIGGTRFANTNTYVAYCFSGKEGFSKFGIYYESSNSDYNVHSPFAYLGFRPAWIMIKSTSTGRAWAIYDNKRSPVNPAYLWLQTSTNTEQSDSTNMDIDFMANGFKVKGGSGLINTTGEEYVFAAFAEMPLKYATAR